MLERLKLILRFILISTRAQLLMLSEDEKEYIINGIKYFVSPRYLTDKKGDTFETTIDGKKFKGRVTKADDRKALEINLVVRDKNDKE